MKGLPDGIARDIMRNDAIIGIFILGFAVGFGVCAILL